MNVRTLRRLHPHTSKLTTLSPIIALSKRNSNAVESTILLHRLSSVLIEYLKELEDESIWVNFVIAYELPDEMLDFGYPQMTLQECVSCSIFETNTHPHGPLQESHKRHPSEILGTIKMECFLSFMHISSSTRLLL